MTNETNNLLHPVETDVDVMSLRAGQAVSGQAERRVRIAGAVRGRRVKVLELVERLTGELEPERLDQSVEPVLHVVDRLDLYPVADAGHLPPTPRIPLARSEKKLVIRTLLQDGPKGFDGFGPQRNDVILSGLPAAVVDVSDVQINDGLGELRKLHGPVPAVECEVEHGEELATARQVSGRAGADRLDLRVDDGTDLIGSVKLPLHRRLGAGAQLVHDLDADRDGATPLHFLRVPAGRSKVSDRTLGGVGPVGLSDRVVNLLRGVRRPVVGKDVTAVEGDAFGRSSILVVHAVRDFLRVGVCQSLLQPLVEQPDHRRGDVLRRLHGQHGSARRDRRGLAVVNGDRLFGRHFPADPSGAPADALHVAAGGHRERETFGHFGRPFGGHRVLRVLGALLCASSRTPFMMPERPFCKRVVTVFPAAGALLFDRCVSPLILQGKSTLSNSRNRLVLHNRNPVKTPKKSVVSPEGCYAPNSGRLSPPPSEHPLNRPASLPRPRRQGRRKGGSV